MRSLQWPGVLVAAILSACGSSRSDGQITQFDWSSGTGAQSWQVAGNWTPAGIPNDPQHVANLSVSLGADLNVGLGSSGSVTVAGVNIGSPGGAVTTEVSSSGATLRFQNDFVQELANADFNNNGMVDGGDLVNWQRGFGMSGQDVGNGDGDANNDMTVDATDREIWEENYGLDATGINNGIAIIRTGGLPGSLNRISANVLVGSEDVEIIGQTDLTISGGIAFEDDSPIEGVIGGSISNTSAGITTTLAGPINLANQFDGLRGDFGLNTSQNSQGTLVVDGVVSDGGLSSDLFIGVGTNNARRPLNTVRINSANTHSGGTIVRRANIEVANDAAFGTGAVRQQGPANQFGYNMIAVGGDRNLNNTFVVAQWQTFKGSNSFTLDGNITQTNNRGFVNQLEPGATLTMTGLLEIWEDDEALVREFEFDGEGRTVFTGVIRDDPELSGNDRRIRKSGTGAMLIDVDAGNNQHSGPTIVDMGNLHYADNDSLNVGLGMIVSRGGAVGVDTGVAANTTFAAKIDPSSTGGLMLAPSDAAATLNFTTTLANAAGMTVAAPESGITFTGSITPANSTYGLGGGSGTLTLPDAQLSGANNVEIRNGGTVELLGDNTYTGGTTVITKYTSSHQEQAEADSSNANDATGLFYDRLVAPTLVVDDLADGGSPSSIGAASSDSANLLIQGSTLKYIGDGDTTNRLFTIGTGGATIDSSGAGAVVFSNTGMLGRDDAEDRLGSLDDFTRNPNELYDFADTSDIIIGMTVSDPDPGAFLPNICDENCIPAVDEDGDPVVVTGISDDGSTLGISADTPFNQKLNTRIVFGVVDRTLTFAGDNADDNTVAAVISDSDAGSVVHVDKVGSGKWVLTGANAYSGDTTVAEGELSITNAFLHDDSEIDLGSSAVLDLDFVGEDTVGALLFNGIEQAVGRWGAPGNAGADFTSAQLSGTGLLNVGGVLSAAAGAAVPEPAGLLLIMTAIGGLSLGGRRR